MLAAGIIEWMQYFLGREASAQDLLASIGGGVAGLWWSVRDHFPPPSRRALGILLLIWMLGTFWPAAVVLFDRWHAARDFPLLASFESGRELGRWDPNGMELTRDRGFGTHGRWSLRAHPAPGFRKYPGFFLTDCLGDWRSFSTLAFDVVLSAAGPTRMWFRADDRREQPAYAERAEYVVELEPGSGTVHVPLKEFLRTPQGRSLRREGLTRFGIFFETTESIEAVWIDHIRLTP